MRGPIQWPVWPAALLHDERGFLEVAGPRSVWRAQDGQGPSIATVFFIATANSLATMPPALRDRLEIVQLQAYTPTENAAIGTRHLWPKVLANHGLPETQADPKGAGRARTSGGRGAAQGGHGAGVGAAGRLDS